jgi:hypothetical protein
MDSQELVIGAGRIDGWSTTGRPNTTVARTRILLYKWARLLSDVRGVAQVLHRS